MNVLYYFIYIHIWKNSYTKLYDVQEEKLSFKDRDKSSPLIKTNSSIKLQLQSQYMNKQLWVWSNALTLKETWHPWSVFDRLIWIHMIFHVLTRPFQFKRPLSTSDILFTDQQSVLLFPIHPRMKRTESAIERFGRPTNKTTRNLENAFLKNKNNKWEH